MRDIKRQEGTILILILLSRLPNGHHSSVEFINTEMSELLNCLNRYVKLAYQLTACSFSGFDPSQYIYNGIVVIVNGSTM